MMMVNTYSVFEHLNLSYLTWAFARKNKFRVFVFKDGNTDAGY